MIEPIGFNETEDEYIDRLEAEIERLREALEPFAKIANFCHPRHRDSRPFIFGFDTAIAQRLTIGDLRGAALALAPSERATEIKS